MKSWKTVWREGFVPSLPVEGLRALLKVLKEDDPSIIQGSTTTPPPLSCVQEWPVEAADAALSDACVALGRELNGLPALV